MTGVYGPCDRRKRKNFWRELEEVWAYANGKPWCVGSDFNVTHFTHDRNGSGSRGAGMYEFDNFISRGGLIDLPLKGGQFTWSNRRDISILSRLDRFLVNVDWEEE